MKNPIIGGAVFVLSLVCIVFSFMFTVHTCIAPWFHHQRTIYVRSLESEEAAINIPNTEPFEINRIDSLAFLDKDPGGLGYDYVLYAEGCGCHLHVAGPHVPGDTTYIARCFDYRYKQYKELLNESEVLSMIPDHVFETLDKRSRLWIPQDNKVTPQRESGIFKIPSRQPDLKTY